MTDKAKNETQSQIIKKTAKKKEKVLVEADKIAQVNIKPKRVKQTIIYQTPPPIKQKNGDANIDNFFDSLNERYQSRYEQKLDRYFEITLTIKEENSRKPNPGEAIDIINEIFQEKGRLLIVGNPGAGKTVLLLKLALRLLEKCDFSKKNWSFPVIFNLASWTDNYNKFEDWIIAKLHEDNGLSKAYAKTLLEADRFILLLDGLDELARNEDEITANKKRANCLISLNGYLKRKRQTVICCRRAEFIQMDKLTEQDAPVSAKVEVLDLTESEIKSALVKANRENYAAAKVILNIIDTNKALLEVIKTPFYFTTAFTIFDSQNEDKEYTSKYFSDDNYRDEVYLKSHLVGKFARLKFNEDSTDVKFINRIPILRNTFFFNKGVKFGWLFHLAYMMEKRQLVTFELADLQTFDLKSLFIPWWLNNNLVFCLAGGLLGSLFGIFYEFLFALSYYYALTNKFTYFLNSVLFQNFKQNLTSSIKFELIGGLILGLVTSLLSKGFKDKNNALTNWDLLLDRDYKLKRSNYDGYSGSIDESGCGWILLIFLLLGLIIVQTFYRLIFGEPLSSLSVGIGICMLVIITSFVFWSIKQFSLNLKTVNHRFEPIKTPYKRFHKSIVRNIFAILLFTALNFLISVRIIGSHSTNTKVNLLHTIYFVSVMLTVFIIITTPLFKHFILRICLFLNGELPLKLAAFLDYAAKVGVLEKDGGFWRFRHQNIQEYIGRGITWNSNGSWRLSADKDKYW